MDFGTAIHAACENYLNTRVMDDKVFLQKLYELWKEHQEKLPDEFKTSAFKHFAREGRDILKEVPAWLEETFPNWELVGAEHVLYEHIEEHPHAFKGMIDCVIKVPGKKTLIWIIDFKSCAWGWKREKKIDPSIKAQLVFYKNFWCKKTGTDPKNVRCAFVLLKRTAKPGKRCEKLDVSVGDVTTKRALTVVNNMLCSMKKGIAIKNRTSCEWCEYRGTEWCP